MAADQVRIIKKYSNRRLYDLTGSCFLTLEGVRELVIEQTPFQVVDSKTGHDITRAVLLQILAEEEEKENGAPIFSTRFLLTIIRFYGNDLQNELGGFFEKSFLFFLQQNSLISAKVTSSLLTPPNSGVAIMSTLSEMAEQNVALWRQWQKGLATFPSAVRKKKGAANGEN